MFMNVKGNSNGTWKIINNFINKRKSNVNEKPEFKDDNGIIINEEEIAQKFNEYFVNIGKHISANTKNCNVLVSSFLRGSHMNSLFLKPITEKEIIEIVQLYFKNGKSPGYDSIDSQVIKRAIHILCKPLCNIFNHCFKNGVFPDCGKISKVIPSIKVVQKMFFTNYRPISLLICFSKILEKCMCVRLLNC